MHQQAADRDSRGPCSGTGPYLFVSYARADRSRVEPILTVLRSSGVRIWYDDGPAAGQRFGDEIERRVHESTGVIVFLSANSTARKDQHWVYQETKLAATHGKEVIPVRLDDTTLPLDWTALVEHRQMVQADAKSPRDRAIDALRSRATALGCRRDAPAEFLDIQKNFDSLGRIGFGVLCGKVLVGLALILWSGCKCDNKIPSRYIRQP